MRALGDRRRKAPVETKKTEEVTPQVEETAPVPAEETNSFDESVVIS